MISTALTILSSARTVRSFCQVGIFPRRRTASSHTSANSFFCSLGLPPYLISSSSLVGRPSFNPTEYQSVTMYRSCATSSLFGGSYSTSESAGPGQYNQLSRMQSTRICGGFANLTPFQSRSRVQSTVMIYM